jgi:hypothetical protein
VAIAYNTSIVTGGISLLLDPSNLKSYPGSGSAWTDLVNRIPFASQGVTQTPYSSVGGVQAFTFNNSGFWQSTSGDSAVDLGGDCTVILWLYGADVTTRKTLFEKVGTTNLSYQQELAMTLETSESFTYFSRLSPDYDSGGTATIDIGAWSMTAIKMSSGKSTTARTGFYSKNGSAWLSSYTSRSNVAVVPAGAVQIGTGYAGTMENCSVGTVMCYNKMLSDVEIRQNFDALRGRYNV